MFTARNVALKCRMSFGGGLLIQVRVVSSNSVCVCGGKVVRFARESPNQQPKPQRRLQTFR
eukprot:5183803-Amphidinium_carterae.1